MGIENIEVKVSNLFAYYIENNIEFLNVICDLAKIDRIDSNSHYVVKREYYFTLKGYKNNYIDILVRIGKDENNPDRVICIENKIYASEGYKQTERYQKGIDALFPKAKRDYVFITKNNGIVNLTSMRFRHIRYMDLIEKIHESQSVKSLEYIDDFCEYYYEKEHRHYLEIEGNNSVLNSKSFIDYFDWKANHDTLYNDLFVCKGVSAKNTKTSYLQVSKQSWLIRSTGIADEMSIHLEGNNKSITIHFETYPYIPYSKISKDKIGLYQKVRDYLRDKMKDINISGVETYSQDERSKLTLVKFKIKEDTTNLRKVVDKWIDIVNKVDLVIIDYQKNAH